MTMLVTLEQAKAHLRVTHTADDDDIILKTEAASAAIINYLKPAVTDAFLDTAGDPIMTGDSPPVSTVPRIAQQATLLMLGWMFCYREGDDEKAFIPGYLPAPIISLLYPLRDPTLS